VHIKHIKFYYLQFAVILILVKLNYVFINKQTFKMLHNFSC